MEENFDMNSEDEQKQNEYDEAVKRGEKWADEFDKNLPLQILAAVLIGGIFSIIFTLIF